MAARGKDKTQSSEPEGVIEAAWRLLTAGVSVMPVQRDKSPGLVRKRRIRWQSLQERPLERAQAPEIFEEAEGIGVICGAVSGQVECIDFDNQGSHYEPWRAVVREHGLGPVLDRCYIQRTQNMGWHVVYRWTPPEEGAVRAGGEKLTMAAGRTSAVIETRGEKQYFCAAPTPGYERVQGDLTRLPVIEAEERDGLLAACRLLSESEPARAAEEGGERPGADFERRATWAQILEPAGWTLAHERDGVGHWCRPGKTARQGIGATTNHGGADRLRVFTTSTALEPSSYSKFGAYAALNHGGDHRAAATALRRQGYGAGDAPARGDRAPARRGSGILVFEEKVLRNPEYLWEPYLQIGKLTLVDADGGTGKSGFMMFLAGCLSNGYLPYHPIFPPMRTLYYGLEDEPEELATVYTASGGRPGAIGFVQDNFPLDRDGLARVARDIDDFGPQLVIFDPLIAFMSGLMPNINDPLPVQRVLDGLARVAAEKRVAIVNLRHTRKMREGDIASQIGMGSVQFRNRHRSQLVMLYHPEIEVHRGVVVVSHEKGSILSPVGEPFCIRREGNAVRLVHDVDAVAGGVRWRPGRGRRAS